MTDTKWRIGKAFAKQSKAARGKRPSARIPFLIGQACCGSVLPEDAALMAAASPAFSASSGALVLDDAGMDEQARSAALSDAAGALREAGRLRHPTGELLEVRAAKGSPRLALLDRCAFRRLGLLTLAVRMNGVTPDGRIWTARRSLSKAICPGRWDSLAAGLAAASETPVQAMRREAQEEAGLEDGRDYTLAPAFRFFCCCETEDGWLREESFCYTALLQEGAAPRNQDGEADALQLLDADQMAELIARGLVTREASLTMLFWLSEKTGKQLPEGFYQPLA